jgi:serine/threonine protein kinase
MQPGDDQTTVGFSVPAGLSALAVRYELLAEIGRGGMGIVYKARDRQTGDLVALKVIHPAVASDPRLIERFTNELLLARRITHKNVCRVHDLNDFGGTLVISMELVDGRSLRQMLRDLESVSVRQGVKIVRQVVAGLGEAHAEGVVHRDLKPENTLIGRDGAVKIMDFRIARLMDSRMTATGHLVGTPAYMSPEQAEGKPADARSDIYSLPLVMYEMFCGRQAFPGETPLALDGSPRRDWHPPSMATVEPVPLIALTLFVDYLLLVATFRRFDLLTLGAAIGTFALWWANYPLLVMQQPIGAVGPWIAFAVWGLLLSAAAATAFQSALRRSYRRLAAAFE